MANRPRSTLNSRESYNHPHTSLIHATDTVASPAAHSYDHFTLLPLPPRPLEIWRFCRFHPAKSRLEGQSEKLRVILYSSLSHLHRTRAAHSDPQSAYRSGQLVVAAKPFSSPELDHKRSLAIHLRRVVLSVMIIVMGWRNNISTFITFPSSWTLL